MKRFLYAGMLLLGMVAVFNACEKDKDEDSKDKVWVVDRGEYVFMNKVVQTGTIQELLLYSPFYPEGTKLCFSPNGTVTVIDPSGWKDTKNYSLTDNGYEIGGTEYILSSNGELTVPLEEAVAFSNPSKWRQEDIIQVGNYNGPLIFTNIRIARYLSSGANELTVYSGEPLPFFYEYKNGTRVPCNLVGLTYKKDWKWSSIMELPNGIYPPASYDSANKQIYWWRHDWFVEDGDEFTGEDNWGERDLNEPLNYDVITLSSFDFAFDSKQVVLKPEK